VGDNAAPAGRFFIVKNEHRTGVNRDSVRKCKAIA